MTGIFYLTKYLIDIVIKAYVKLTTRGTCSKFATSSIHNVDNILLYTKR